jgi:N utilization substance protein B
MSTPRHQAREIALQVVYRYDSTPTLPSDPHQLAMDLRSHFEHFHVPSEVREFAAELAAGTLMDRQNIDTLIETHAENWKISRMASIDRTILRLALFELRGIPGTPPSVVLDEAIELAKQFGTAESAGFINGILDAALKRSIQRT